VTSLGPIDLLLGCGDLPAEYLDALATRYQVPLLFVRGNHDPPRPQGDYPLGGDLDGRVVEMAGLRIAGLEGAHWYRGGPQQYREWQMSLKVWRLGLRLRRRPLDILLLHGHVHPHGSLSQRDTTIGPTQVINVHGHRILELEVELEPERA